MTHDATRPSAQGVRLAIGGGGTGGHVTPALAIGERLRARGGDPLFIGAERGIETRLVPDAGFELAALPVLPLVGRGLLDRVRALWALARATLGARRALARHRSQGVVAVGGYASVPPALAARTLGLPVVLVSIDAAPGLANRLVARFAARICVAFESGAAAFAAPGRTVVTGAPLREDLVRRFAVARPYAAAPARRTSLFVFGGSLGARQLNDAMLEATALLDPAAWTIVHQTGEADRKRVAEGYAAAGFDAEVIAFERDMPRRYAEADLVLCRAGATSIAELALAGRPALLAPLAHVGGGEQFANAAEVERCGAGRVLDTHDLRVPDLVAALLELAADRTKLAEMASAAARRARPDAADRVIDEVLALLAPSGKVAA